MQGIAAWKLNGNSKSCLRQEEKSQTETFVQDNPPASMVGHHSARCTFKMHDANSRMATFSAKACVGVLDLNAGL